MYSPAKLVAKRKASRCDAVEPQEVTRYITREAERELWARAAGRCQFAGCNIPLYKSPVTQEVVNISEKAHIYAFSKSGPRGRGAFRAGDKRLNDVGNLMLVCHGCHRKVDSNPDRYPSELLLQWKNRSREASRCRDRR